MSAARLPLNSSTGALELVDTRVSCLAAGGDIDGITPMSRKPTVRPNGDRVNGPWRAALRVSPRTESGSEREVLGVHVIDERPELLDHLLGLFLVGLLDPSRLLEHVFLGEDRRPDADGERDGVGRPADTVRTSPCALNTISA